MSLAPGSTLGPYAIRAELGHGGMGVVYTAHDPRLKRQVAIKLLTADLTRDETYTSANVGNTPRVSIHFELADQNQIIGP